MLGKLYSTDILTLSSTLKNGRLGQPDGTARKVSKLCGSDVEVDVMMDGDKVADIALRVQACALGQASAAILNESVIGATRDELVGARDALRAMLKQGDAPPGERFASLSLLSSVRDYPARHQSTLLAWDAVIAAINDADGTAN